MRVTMLYKTLIAGQSIHGGTLQWSLPRDGQPGKWHKVYGELSLCNRGLHLTDDPAQWWKPGCVVFLAEGDGIVGTCDDKPDRKIVCRRARLLREATPAELTALCIYSGGEHMGEPGKISIASGSATVRAYGSATVRAYDYATVEASGSATVRAYGSATVEASGSATVRAYDSATVRAYDSATVISWRGKPGVKLIPKSRAVWVERGDGSAAPLVHVAPESEANP